MRAEDDLPQPSPSRRTKKQASYISLFLPVPWTALQYLVGYTICLPWQTFGRTGVADRRQKLEKKFPCTLLVFPMKKLPWQQPRTNINEFVSVRKASLSAWHIPLHKPEPHRNFMLFYP